MSKNPARLNDSHDCPKKDPNTHGGGKIITADETVLFQGQPVACEGDTVKCQDGSSTTIQPGNACVMINGKRLALVGDKTEHDGKITSGADSIHADEGKPFVFIGANVKIGKNVSFNITKKEQHIKWKSIDIIPANIREALKEAMKKEGVPDSQYDSFAWIMAQESGGHVGSKNSHSSARGLYQLTRANYHLNPNGENSFGNPIEEAQGGIRYIKKRYGSPDKAVEFWKAHKWY